MPFTSSVPEHLAVFGAFFPRSTRLRLGSAAVPVLLVEGKHGGDVFVLTQPALGIPSPLVLGLK